MENRRRFGFRDDDELIAVLVVLLLVALLAFYFFRSFGRQQPLIDTEQPIAVVDDGSAETDGDVPAIEADGNASIDTGTGGDVDSSSSVDGSTDSGGVDTAIIATAAPVLALATNNFIFYDVSFSGTGEPDTSVQVEVDGTSIGAADVSSDGSWVYESTAGEITSGDHSVTVSADGFRSEPQTFTLGTPVAPQLAGNYNNTVVEPKQYLISGTGSPNWEVAIGVANADPYRLKTDENGNWSATVALTEPGTYELEVFAVNSDGTINPEASSGRNTIIVTADGLAPVDNGSTDGVVAPVEGDDEGDMDGAEGDGAEENGTDEGEGEAVEAEPNLYQQLQATGQHGTLLAAIDATGLTQTLEDAAGSYTLFAPTDNAFGSLPSGVVDAFMADPDALRSVLVEHVVPGEVPAEMLSSAETTSVTNLAENALPVTHENEGVRISNSNVTQADIVASNGLIHSIDKLILPPSESAQPVIDSSGVPVFEGSFLTVVGTAQPGNILILTLNGVEFGSQVVGNEGTFEIAGDVSDGEYEILAYALESTNLLRAISDPVYLTVSNQ